MGQLMEREIKRDFIGITFRCCNVYSRIYLNADKNAYTGICPRCYRKKVIVEIVQTGGLNERFFEVE
jgi:hypothetical protein